jgi:hypothetical protein
MTAHDAHPQISAATIPRSHERRRCARAFVLAMPIRTPRIA